MRIDLTYKLTREMLDKFLEGVQNDGKYQKFGHIGTHFDVMDKSFPLEYCELSGKVFDVSNVENRDIESGDFEMDEVEEKDFVIFHTGMMDKEGYGTEPYFRQHPQLSYELIRELIKKNVGLIGVDFAGVRRGAEHAPADQLCADNSIFIIENLNNTKQLLEAAGARSFTMHTYPLNLGGATGLPARVIAELA